MSIIKVCASWVREYNLPLEALEELNALSCAGTGRHGEAVQVLLDHGANINKQSLLCMITRKGPELNIPLTSRDESLAECMLS
jgi:hypothetical protein